MNTAAEMEGFVTLDAESENAGNGEKLIGKIDAPITWTGPLTAQNV